MKPKYYCKLEGAYLNSIERESAQIMAEELAHALAHSFKRLHHDMQVFWNHLRMRNEIRMAMDM